MGCTKMQSPGIDMVLHWPPPDVPIFGTDPSLLTTNMKKLYYYSIYILGNLETFIAILLTENVHVLITGGTFPVSGL